MASSINIGVDFGSTGLRTAYVSESGHVMIVPEADGGNWPWLLCEPTPTTGLGVTFPSLKNKLGVELAVTVNGGLQRPAEVVSEAFRVLKRSVEARAAMPASQVVVSVPARYSASQRATLREVVFRAGFTDVHLINDSVAAVIAHTAQSTTGATVLVYSMGYVGFEAGVVRAVRGHYRTLGYEGGSAPTGQTLDEYLLRTVFALLAQHNLMLNTAKWDTLTWMQVRAAAQQVKEELSANLQAVFPIFIKTPKGQSRISFSRMEFEKALGPWLQATINPARELLEQAHLGLTDIDVVLLTGGSTDIPVLQSLVEKTLSKKPVLATSDILARGAALYAARLEAMPASPALEPEKSEQPVEILDIPATESALRAALVDSKEPLTPPSEQLVLETTTARAPASAPDREAVLRHARQLAEQGQLEEAKLFLQRLIEEAQALLSNLSAPVSVPKSSINPRSRRAIARAQQMIKEKQYEEAVLQAHMAWQASPDSPDIFEQMIEIHCQAALANPTLENYENARNWLSCAYEHDQSNLRVRQALAERHYIQAKLLVDRGKRKDALQAVEQCLRWEPEHRLAMELQQTLTRR